MRRYWVPALMSNEIAEPDGPQVKVQSVGREIASVSQYRRQSMFDQRILLAPWCVLIFWSQ
jgi:hypothetical protein